MSKYPGRIVTDLAPAGYSVAFDGTGDYLSLTQSAFAVGTSNFTLEAWVYLTAAPGTEAGVISSFNTGGGQGFYLAVNSSRQPFFAVGNGATSNPTVTGTAISLNTWVHLAGVRSSNTLTLYVNGTSVGTPTSATASIDRTLLGIGLAYPNSPQGYITGYISNARVTSSALYTAAFTPPTQLFNVTNTQLLTCNSPAIVDQSNNAFAITVNGDSKVSTLTPFTAYVPYNPALGASTPGIWTVDEALQAKGTRRWNMYDPSFNQTTLLLHGNGTNGAQNNTFVDSSSNNFSITRNGNTTQGSFSPFSLQSGQWSNYFNGSSYLTAAANSGFSLAGDFTIEMWINPASLSTANSIIIIESAASSGLYLAINAGTSTVNIFLNSSAASFTATPVSGIALNVWSHIALVRSGSTVTFYVNGVAASGTGSSAATLGSSTTPFRIGGFTGAYTGYISNLRVVNGRAVYTSNFTPSPFPLTATSGGQNPPTGTQTTLLTCQANRFVDAGGLVTPITISVAGGTPSVQPFSPFYPTAAYTPATVGGSVFLDGTVDYLLAPSTTSSAFAWGTGDYSIECWVYLPTTTTYTRFITASTAASGNIDMTATTLALNYFDGATYALGTMVCNQWMHLAITRKSGTIRTFQNGVLRANGSNSTNASTNVNFGIGATAAGAQEANAKYIAGIRMVKGGIPSAYDTTSTTNGTQIFTPPTAPFTGSESLTGGSVSLLMNFTNAGIVDSTAKNVLETVGNAQISTTQSRFGGTSMYFDGTGDALFIPPDQKENLRFGTGNFTIEFWAWKSSNGSTNYDNVISVGSDGNFNGGFSLELSSTRGFAFIYDAAVRISSNFNPNDSTWHHYAIVRNGSTFALYKDGVQLTTATLTPTLGITGNAFVGAGASSTQVNFNGYIDDLRITKGVARYTANFTPQTSQWQDE